jgi:O-antigen/teichoic acid export membrane protein
MWTIAGFVLSTIIRFGSNLLMTRLLAPEMFGIMSIATTVMVGLGMFSDLGLRQSVVRSKRGNEPVFLNTAWSIQILRGLLLWIAALCVSGVILLLATSGAIPQGSVYAAPSLPFVIATVSLSAAIGGLDSTKLIEASRDLWLKRITKIEIASQISGLAIMIVWVWIDRSIWALVAGSLGSSLARVILGHATLPGVKNRWEWDKAAAWEVLHFGKWILLASILGFLVNSGDRLLLGGLVDSTTLGLYFIASLCVGIVDGVLSRIIADVTFPAFSEVVRERPADLRRNYYAFHGVISTIAYLAAGVLMASGGALISLLYDHRYEQSGWMLQVLAGTLLTVPFRLATQTFLALGQPKLQSNIVLARLVLLFAVTPVFFHFYGLPGAIWAIVVSHFSSVPFVIFYNLRNNVFNLYREVLHLCWIPIGFAAGKLLAVAINIVR